MNKKTRASGLFLSLLIHVPLEGLLPYLYLIIASSSLESTLHARKHLHIYVLM